MSDQHPAEQAADPGTTRLDGRRAAVPPDAGDLLLAVARAAIADELGAPVQAEPSAPAWAHEPGACFVTLTMHGRLRGCIGSLEAERPLLDDVRANAAAAATCDPRFAPMTAAELDAVRIEVSVLSPARPLAARGLGEAYAALRPGVDGVIVRTGTGRRATFLPQVWDDLAEPADLLAHLWLKAGIEPGTWSPGTELSTYTVEAWHERDRDD